MPVTPVLPSSRSGESSRRAMERELLPVVKVNPSQRLQRRSRSARPPPLARPLKEESRKLLASPRPRRTSLMVKRSSLRPLMRQSLRKFRRPPKSQRSRLKSLTASQMLTASLANPFHVKNKPISSSSEKMVFPRVQPARPSSLRLRLLAWKSLNIAMPSKVRFSKNSLANKGSHEVP